MLCVIDYTAYRVAEHYNLPDWMNLNGVSYYRMSPGSQIPEKVSKIVISGGPRHSSECEDAVRIIQQYQVPILGICLGCMGIVRAFGGTLKDAEESEPIIKVEGHDFLGFCLPSEASAAHREIISSVSDELEPCLWKSDTKEIVAVRHRRRPIFGCMFHPESPKTTCGNTLLNSFLSL